jgi:hypothetical protein
MDLTVARLNARRLQRQGVKHHDAKVADARRRKKEKLRGHAPQQNTNGFQVESKGCVVAAVAVLGAVVSAVTTLRG